jgi:hypothetical protein
MLNWTDGPYLEERLTRRFDRLQLVTCPLQRPIIRDTDGQVPGADLSALMTFLLEAPRRTRPSPDLLSTRPA